MADRIKGITIQIGSDTVGLQKSLSDVNKKSRQLQSELKDVERLLKFNPGNVEALAQKQKLLESQVSATTDKLNRLKDAEKQVQDQFEKGKISEEQYRAFRREIEFTEGSLDGLKNKLSDMKVEQDKIASSTKQLNTLFDATGSSVEDFSDVLGTRLTNAIKNGTASSKQLEEAIRKIGQESLGVNVDIDKMRKALSSVDDGASLKAVKKELGSLAKEAHSAEESVDDLGTTLEGIAGTLVAGGGLAGTIQKALDTSTLNTNINIGFDVPEESKAAVKEAIRGIEAYGVDGEAALEGVRRQWTLNKDATDESNAAVVKYAGTVAKSFSGIDFTELVQETNELAAGIGVSNENAIALINSLLKAGFPPEQLDTIAEYGTQMKDAGFSAAEIQAIFEKGIDLKSWNIDNLNDGVKEARINMAAFGEEVPKAMSDLLEGTGLSAKQMQMWGKAVAEGGENGSKAMSEMVSWLDGIEDKSLKNAIATQIMGTMWEDQGQNMISVFQGVDGAVDKTVGNLAEINKQTNALDADPAIKMQQAFAQMRTALEPLLLLIASFVSGIAEWISNNPTLAATIAAVATAAGILVGVCMALAPIFITLSGAAAALGVSVGAIVAPIGIAVAAIIGIGTALVTTYQESEVFREIVNSVWESVKIGWQSVLDFFTQTLPGWLENLQLYWEQMITTLSDWEALKDTMSLAWDDLKSIILTKLGEWKQSISDWFIEQKNDMTSKFDEWKTAIETWFSSIPSVIVEKLMEWKNAIIKWTEEQNAENKRQFEKWGTAIQEWFASIPSKITNKLTEWKDAIVKWYGETNEKIKEKLSEWWAGISKWFSEAPGKIGTSLEGWWSKMSTWFSEIPTKISKKLEEWWTAIRTWFTNLPNKPEVKNAGSKMIDKLAEGNKNKQPEFMDKLGKIIVDVATGALAVAVVALIATGREIVKRIISGIKEVDLKETGKDLVRGLISGMGSLLGDIREKAVELASAAKKAAEKFLKIKSPSRVFMQIGEFIGEGLVIGMDNTTSQVSQSAERLAKAAVPDLRENIKISQWQLGEMTRIAKLEAKERYQAVEQWLSKQKELENITAKDEVAVWDFVTRKFELNTEEKRKAQLKLRDAKRSIDQDIFNDEKAWIEERKRLNQLSLTQELQAWEQVASRYAEGSTKRLEAEQQAANVRKSIYDELKKASDDYLSKVKEVNDNVAKEEQRLNEVYEQAVEQRAKSIQGFAGLFDEIKLDKDIVGTDLLTNLENQVSYLEDWTKNVQELANRGIDEGLLKELQDMGPKAGQELAALVKLSDEQLSEYQTLWQTKNQLARTQAVTELEGLRADTDLQIQELHTRSAEQLEELKNEFITKAQSIRFGTEEEFDILSATLPELGRNAIQGLMNGMDQMTPDLMAQARAIANEIRRTIQSALDIHSPSRVMMELGEWIPLGLAEGMKAKMGAVVEASKQMAQASIPNVSAYAAGSATTIHKPFNPQITNYYQQPISPSDVARKEQQMLQRLALEW